MDQNLLTYLESFLTSHRKERFMEVLGSRTNFLTVVAEDVFQMHNASAIVRSCDVFGIQQLHLIVDRFGNSIDKNIAVGAQRWVDVHTYKSSVECIDFLVDQGYRIVATSPSPEAIDINAYNLTDKTALFFGTEKEGLSSEVLEAADDTLQIPMVGFSESLNVSVSVAIILQFLAGKLRQSELPWQLDQEEILKKRLEWTRKTIKNSEQIIERYYSEIVKPTNR
ncbi:MAG: RNA methyltransferase [Flavobacteriaceae bacterium]